jgi:Fe-S cluster biosynthesis and repair protein YggX
MAHMVQCVKLGKEMEGLDEPPFDSPLGQRIYDNVSKQAWQQWQDHMKMLLNEYRLQPWKKEHQDFIVQQMEQYFFGGGAEVPKEYVPENK